MFSNPIAPPPALSIALVKDTWSRICSLRVQDPWHRETNIKLFEMFEDDIPLISEMNMAREADMLMKSGAWDLCYKRSSY